MDILDWKNYYVSERYRIRKRKRDLESLCRQRCRSDPKNPDLLYSALKSEDYALVNDVVPSLTVDEFKQLAAFLCGSAEIEHLSCQSSCPLVHYIYEHELLPQDLLFACMAAILRRPEPIVSSLADDMGLALFGLGLDGLLMELSGQSEDSDGE